MGTIVGGVLAMIAGIVAKGFEEWRSRKSLRAAFRAEILSIIETFELRGHERLFEDMLQQWRQLGTKFPVLVGSHAKPVDAVFSKNTDKIGLLGRDVAGEVVRFYAIIDGLREDVASLAVGEIGRFSQDTKVRLIEEDLRMWREAREIAAKLKRRL